MPPSGDIGTVSVLNRYKLYPYIGIIPSEQTVVLHQDDDSTIHMGLRPPNPPVRRRFAQFHVFQYSMVQGWKPISPKTSGQNQIYDKTYPCESYGADIQPSLNTMTLSSP